jgi:cytochrome P450
MPTEPSELVTSEPEVLAILADTDYVVPPAPPVPVTEQGTLAWLRAHVARFCDGEVHERRRELVEHELAKLDPGTLRAAAAERAGAELALAPGDESFDAMIIARRVPVAVLAAALGVAAGNTAEATEAVLASASGYPNPDGAGPDADAGIQVLTDVLGPAEPEPLANLIGLLEQACDATAALIGNALINADPEDNNTDELIARTLAEDPPVRRTRRLAPDGTPVTLDLSTCTFGAGRRPCPGEAQARALAAGVLDAILETCDLADQPLSYVPSPNLRMPAEFLVSRS